MTIAISDAREVTLALLARRAPGATICPSEVARLLKSADITAPAGDRWRTMMPVVHAAIDRLLAEGSIHISWKGSALKVREGPYRIGGGSAGAQRQDLARTDGTDGDQG